MCIIDVFKHAIVEEPMSTNSDGSRSSTLINSCVWYYSIMFSHKEEDTFYPIHSLAGFYSGENYSKSYRNYRILTDVLIFIVLSATIIQLLISPSEHKESLSVSFVVCISYSLALYYSICFRLQHHRISELQLFLKKIRLSLQQIVGEQSVMEACQSDLKYNNFYVYFGMFVSFMSALLFSIQPILRNAAVFGSDGSKRLQIDIWCPFDFQISFVFEIIVFIQFLTVFWVALRFFANDSFFMYLFRTNITFFKLLSVFSKNVIKPYKTRSFSTKMVRVRQGRYGNKRNLLCPILEVASTFDNEEEMASNSTNVLHKDFNIQANQQLKLFIKTHQLILSSSRKVCQIYGPVMLMYLQALMGFAGVGAFGVLHTNGFEGPQSIAVSFFSIANLMFMYFMCAAGDHLSEQSGSVAKAVVWSPWYNSSLEVCSSLVLVLQQVNTRVQACVVGTPSFPLRCASFVWFLKTLLSVYLFLVEVQNMRKENEST